MDRMKPSRATLNFDRLLAEEFSDLFGPAEDHLCKYREILLQYLKWHSQNEHTTTVASRSRRFLVPFVVLQPQLCCRT